MIGCWFIDTEYNGESFFVRHAYFTGADEPYEKLKRALRADIDEAAWSSLYSTVSRPFDKPKTGKIALIGLRIADCGLVPGAPGVPPGHPNPESLITADCLRPPTVP